LIVVFMFTTTSLAWCGGNVNVAAVNINIRINVDIVNIDRYHRFMARKRAGRYHHGDLSRSLLQEALRTIEKGGVPALTLRAVGQKLGVSRTALYRHFADKSALLAAVATEGFRTLRLETLHAWEAHGGGRKGFEAMGAAYVHFAVAHPAHYRVMFGGYVRSAAPGSDLSKEGAGAFQALVDAIIAQQKEGRLRRDNPLELAQYIWANVHGIAMLAIDGQLKQPIEDVIRFANERMRTGIESSNPKTGESGSRGVGESHESKSPKSRSPKSRSPKSRSPESRSPES
jgi:AcrR family transcriptional regulator